MVTLYVKKVWSWNPTRYEYITLEKADKLYREYVKNCRGGTQDYADFVNNYEGKKKNSYTDGVIKTFQTNKPQLVILGNGDRVWGGAEDHEVMYSIPGSKLDVIIEGLEATHSAGLRYPIPKYMNYKPGFQDAFRKRAKKRAGGTLVKE